MGFESDKISLKVDDSLIIGLTYFSWLERKHWWQRLWAIAQLVRTGRCRI